MMTRDLVQGFIDGHKAGGHSQECLSECLHQYLVAHHTYPVDETTAKKILSDVVSYKL